VFADLCICASVFPPTLPCCLLGSVLRPLAGVVAFGVAPSSFVACPPDTPTSYHCNAVVPHRQKDTAVSAKRYFVHRTNFQPDAYANCSLRYAMEAVQFFSRREQIEWMPIVYEDLLVDPAPIVAQVLLFYGVTQSSARAIRAANRAVGDVREDNERSLQRVHRNGTHHHGDEEETASHTTNLWKFWYARTVDAAFACSGAVRTRQ
jgi:hypothetical protein